MDAKRAASLIALLAATSILVMIPVTVRGQTPSTQTPTQANALFEAERLNEQAQQLYQRGEYAQAIPLAQRALPILEKALGPGHFAVTTSRNMLAFMYFGQGNYTAAEPLYQRALTITTKELGPDHPEVANTLNNLATVYKALGNYGEAENLLKRALIIREQALSPNHRDIIDSLSSLAWVYQEQGNYQSAETLLRRALAIAEKELGSNDPTFAYILNAQAELYRLQNNYQAALPLYQRVLTDHPDVPFYLNNLALLYQAQGNYQAALSCYQHALTIKQHAASPNDPEIADTLNNMSWLYQAQGNYKLALDYLQQGLQLQEQSLSLNLEGGGERQKQLYLQTMVSIRDRAIALHLQTMPQDPAAVRLALTAILQRKGRILDILSSNQQALRQRLDPLGQKLLDDLAATRRQLANLNFNPPEKLSPEQSQLQQKQLATEMATLEDQLSRRSAEFRTQNQPVTLEAVQRLIPAHTALVEFVVYRPFNPKAPFGKEFSQPRYAAYILQAQGNPQGIDLGEADKIDQAIATFRDNLQDSQTPLEQLKASARTLDALVMQPLRARLGAIHTLLLSPDNVLNLIPFEALVDETNHYLVETTAFTYLTSGRDLLRLQMPFASKQPPLLLGDPYFERLPETVALQPPPSNQISSTRSGDLSSQTWPPLPGTAAEVQAVAALLRVPYPGRQSLIGTHASKGALGQVRSPTILHIATHGFFRDAPPLKDAASPAAPTPTENPLLDSGLLLAGFKLKSAQPEARADNGILTALEVTGLDLLGTKLVVLSACNTGVGQLSTGEGVYGLRRAFVIAGAESQLFSLWRIDDGFTPKLMEAYYQKLLAGKGRSEALRQTQLELLQSKDHNHPYYWASFIPSGNWTPMK